MQSTHLATTTKQMIVSQSIHEIFEQSLRANLEAFAHNANMPLKCLQQGDFERLESHLKTTINDMQYLLNSFELYDQLRAEG